MSHSRWADTIFMNGYKERISIQANSPIIWRRIVFWTYFENEAAVGPRKGGSTSGSAAYYTRQMTPVQNTADLRQIIFRGIQGIDYNARTMINAPLNRDVIDVVMDKTQTVNPIGGGMPRIQNRKHYFKGGKIVYHQKESGSVETNSAWSVPGRKSKGNMYIFDLFSDNGFSDSKTTKGQFSCEGRLYWSE